MGIHLLFFDLRQRCRTTLTETSWPTCGHSSRPAPLCPSNGVASSLLPSSGASLKTKYVLHTPSHPAPHSTYLVSRPARPPHHYSPHANSNRPKHSLHSLTCGAW